MTAKEMFRNLGYIKYNMINNGNIDNGNIVYRKKNFYIKFIVRNQTFIADQMAMSFEVDVALFQAIQKQLEELGWLK